MQLQSNPLLEEAEEPESEADELDKEAEVTEEKDDQNEIDEWEEYAFDDEEGYKVREPRDDNKDQRLEGTTAQTTSLYSHLKGQLSLLKLSDVEQAVGEYIIGNIANDGYLCVSVPEMAEELKDELDVDVETIERVLDMIQRFDPPGVGARDLRESLLIQLRRKGMEDTLAYRIAYEHLHDLQRKSILQIAKTMGVSAEKAQQAMDVIRSLSPTPAQGQFDPGAMPVVPDLIVERFGDKYVVMHNDNYTPHLRIIPSYLSLIRRGSKAPKDTKKFIRHNYDQAKWLMKAIEQRRSTMIKVMSAIIERQRDFFDQGPAFIKPLIMDDIAQQVGMNVATISRVSKSKYVQTPFGVFEIKHFFNSGIAKDDGEDVSKRSVKQRIEEIIKGEPPDKPYSDQEIYRRLNEEGIRLARRTVTKYREELKIAPARLRKRVT